MSSYSKCTVPSKPTQSGRGGTPFPSRALFLRAEAIVGAKRAKWPMLAQAAVSGTASDRQGLVESCRPPLRRNDPEPDVQALPRVLKLRSLVHVDVATLMPGRVSQAAPLFRPAGLSPAGRVPRICKSLGGLRTTGIRRCQWRRDGGFQPRLTERTVSLGLYVGCRPRHRDE